MAYHHPAPDGSAPGGPASGGSASGRPPTAGRDETDDERNDRNWDEILQELRVTQTGTQIITGFLLTLPFQQRFSDLDEVQVRIYLVLALLAATTTALALTPVSLHRTLFRQRVKRQLVTAANLIVKIVLVGVATVLAGSMLLIFDVVVGRSAGIVVGSISVVLMVGLAVLLPFGARRD